MRSRSNPIHGSYLRRMGVAAGLVLVALVVAALLSPRGDPEAEWYERTGYLGPELLLQDIDIISDVDPITQEQQNTMPDATLGIAPPITEDVVVERTEMPLPTPAEPGEEGTNTTLKRVVDGRGEYVDERDVVEMNRASQQSSDFVLLFSTSPDYPGNTTASLRSREIIVRVNMYVDETGHVSQAYVDRNNGGPAFEEAVLAAVKQWIYQPLLVEGKPSGFWDLIYFVFNTPTSRGRATDQAPGSTVVPESGR